MLTKKQIPQMEIRCCTLTVRQYSRENPALYGRRSSVRVCPAHNMSSLAPCLHEEADTRLCAHATEAARRADKKLGRWTVGHSSSTRSCCSTGLTQNYWIWVIPVEQQLRVDELWGWQKLLVIIGMKSNCLAFNLFTQRMR